jgi:dipeptidyl-peptidase-4
MVLASTLLMLAATPAAPPPDPVLRQLFETRKFQNGTPNTLRMDRSGAHVFFLRSPADSPVQSLHVFDVDAGQARELLSAEALLRGAAQQLSAAEKAQLERQRVAGRGLVSYVLSDDGKTLVTPLSGRLYRVDVAGLLAGRTVEQSVKMLPPTGVLDPRLSPDGKLLSYVKGWDLSLLELATGKERRLTTGGSERVTHGLAEFVAQEEMDRFEGAWWSPDGKLIAFEEADTRGLETFTLGDPAHPESTVERVPYPRPGKANAKVRLGIVPVAGANPKPTWVKWDAEKYPYLTQVRWPRRGALTIYVMDRAQQHALLLAVDPRTGGTRTLLEEQDPAWINLQHVGGDQRVGGDHRSGSRCRCGFRTARRSSGSPSGTAHRRRRSVPPTAAGSGAGAGGPAAGARARLRRRRARAVLPGQPRVAGPGGDAGARRRQPGAGGGAAR